MRIRRLIFCGVALAAPMALSAQHVRPASAPRIAGIAPARQPAPPNPGTLAPGAVFYGNVPVIVFGDGRVFADFGQGYEQVVRACNLPVTYGVQAMQAAPPMQPTVVQPTVSQPVIGGTTQALPYTPPVPAQQTASQQMLSQMLYPPQSNQAVVNTQSCWALGPGGRVFVGRP